MKRNLKPLPPTEPLTRKMPENTPIESQSRLVTYLEVGCRPPEEFRIGLEQEMFVYRKADGHRPAAYEGPEPGIRTLLEGMSRFDNMVRKRLGTLIGVSVNG
jgi:glutamate--cysteine ligase